MSKEYEFPCEDGSNTSFPYEVETSYHSNTVWALMWCYDTFDINDWRYLKKGKIAFKNEKDATIFILRWSSKNI